MRDFVNFFRPTFLDVFNLTNLELGTLFSYLTYKVTDFIILC